MNKAAFIMPFWADEQTYNHYFLEEAVDSIFQQTNSNWKLIIIDDASTSEKANRYLDQLQEKYDDKVVLHRNKTQKGPGLSRNEGILWAKKEDIPFILFNDADDCSHKRRVEVVMDTFHTDPAVDVIYSHFIPTDEASQLIPEDKLTSSLYEILEGIKKNPLTGKDVWIDMALKTGYINLTSSTSVRTDLASNQLFPNYKVSEDYHTWLRYAAAGGFYYTPEIPCLYRIPQTSDGSASRDREGGASRYYRTGAEVNLEGFMQAITIAEEKKRVFPFSKEILLARFFMRLAETYTKENQFNVAKDQLKNAYELLDKQSLAENLQN